nr:hypothetical protein BaRGS_019851 [Batillaria attramentaria]
MSENKRYAARMALQQRRLDKEQKMMLSRVWHQKELLMDDYILINVRTPSPARPASSPFGSSVFPKLWDYYYYYYYYYYYMYY